MTFNMTEQRKEKASLWGLGIYRTAMTLGIFSLVFNFGVLKEYMIQNSFDSGEQKAKVLQVAEDHMTQLEVYKEILRITNLENEQNLLKQDVQAIKDSQRRIEELLGKINSNN